MEIGSAVNISLVAKAAENSVLIARKALTAQKLEGKAAINLIEHSNAGLENKSGDLVDLYV